jgi:hypothetical protein
LAISAYISRFSHIDDQLFPIETREQAVGELLGGISPTDPNAGILSRVNIEHGIPGSSVEPKPGVRL